MVPRGGTALLCCLLVTGMTACTSSGSTDSTVGSIGGDGTVPPFLPRVSTAPADCRASTTTVALISADPSARPSDLTAKVDSTKTAMLVTNSSMLTYLVWPHGSSRVLDSKAYAAPTDQAALLALTAVMPLLGDDPYLPVGVPRDQLYVVPPDFSVCVIGPAGAPFNALTDKWASVAYRAAHSQAGRVTELAAKTPSGRQRAVEACAQDAFQALRAQPQLSEFDYYASLFSVGRTCQSAYKTFVVENVNAPPVEAERATQTTAKRILQVVRRLPPVMANVKFVVQLVR